MNEMAAKLLAKGPIWFCERILGSSLFDYQKDIINAVFKYPYVTVKSSNSVGKSYLAANLALAFLYLHQNSIVLTTAPNADQVEKIIWKEIRQLYNNVGNNFDAGLGGNLLPKNPELYIKSDWFAYGLTPKTDARLQGYHAVDILLIIDESGGVRDEIFDAADRILTTSNAHILQIGNPNPPKGNEGNKFFDSFNSPLYKKFSISAFDTANFKYFGVTRDKLESGEWKELVKNEEMPYPYLVNPSWAYNIGIKSGFDSPEYYIGVLGDYHPEGSAALIPFDWLEKIVWN